MSNEKIYQAPDGSLLSEHDYRHLSTGQQNQCKIFEMEKMEEMKLCKCFNHRLAADAGKPEIIYEL